jgi:hypothetical protein
VQTDTDAQIAGVGTQKNFQALCQRYASFQALGSKSRYRYGMILLR